ncbi:MAG: SOS response-associated peptidase [Cytophagaceae bacterium]
MCGRYSFTHTKDKISKRFDIEIKDWKPRYNVAPQQIMPVITDATPHAASFFRWGLIPSWSLEENTGANLFNARAENVFTKAPFKHAIRAQRCLVPADGYFEWKREGKNRIPHRIMLSSDEAFSFAGLWESWEDKSGEIINTYTIITTTANSVVREINERMPVILPKDLERTWLQKDLKDQDITDLLKPYDSSKMTWYKAHRSVNKEDHDSLECIQVAPKIYPGESFSLFE